MYMCAISGTVVSVLGISLQLVLYLLFSEKPLLGGECEGAANSIV